MWLWLTVKAEDTLKTGMREVRVKDPQLLLAPITHTSVESLSW